MHPQAGISLPDLRRRLWQTASALPDELALAAHALHGRAPSEEEWSDALDFAAVEWVDADGLTGPERLRRAGEAPRELERWPWDTRNALWTVDGWEEGLVLLRDVATEEEIAVRAPGAEADLTRRTVLRARIVPWQEGFRFFGEPALYGEQGVIGRQSLLAAWRDSPEPEIIARMRALRLAFAEQRDQRAAFSAHFGRDLVVFPTADALEREMAAFLNGYLQSAALPRLGGRSHAEAFRARKGTEAPPVELRLGDTLRGPGRPAVSFDDLHGVHFLPAYAELRDHLQGRAAHPDVLALYLSRPELPAFSLLNAATSPDVPIPGFASLAAALAALKPDARAVPSALPTLDDAF